MWKLHRYYLRELGTVFGITFTVLFAIVLVSLVARGIQRAQGGGAFDAALIMLFWALDAFPHLLPIAFLLAVVLTFARAVQDRELVAIRSAGISPRVPLTAALLLGVALTIVGSLAMHSVVPYIHFKKYRVVAEVMRNIVLNMRLTSDRIPLLDTGYVLTYRERTGLNEFRDCTIYLPPGKTLMGAKSPILRVDMVSILLNQDSETLTIRLDGVRDPLGGYSAGSPALHFPLHDIVNKDRRTERDDDLTSDQLLAEVLRDVHPEPEAAVYTLLRRSSFALLPLLLAPIAFCIATFARERGRVVALLLGLVPLGIFHMGDVLGARVLQATDQPISGLLPLALLLVPAIPFCWRELHR